ncbi:Ran GTPase-activating protein 1 [Erysiphe neolycopersici]|uniref:Ran GTPase-activating protein 1 n=1 Tax=Erysiphe neolycopersici TaxID=212602 RepID=A0A420HD13_9PEZI|nr:Ran GTPase-activating protein 1 [Erysiphe neolycopersici]
MAAVDLKSDSKIFSIEGKGLKLDSTEDIEKYVGPLRQMDDVVEIRLQGNTLGVEACRVLGEIIQTKKNLQAANFADIFTGRLLSEIPKAITYLLQALLTLPNLYEINLNDNAFGLNTSVPLIEFLSSHIPLRHLILNNNGLGPETGIKIAEALVKLHAKKTEARKAGIEVPDLETIICGRNRLESASMMAWAKVYSLHTSVKKVKMVQNGIRSIGIYYLLKDGLKHAKGIRVLDLEDNTFLNKGSSALANVVTGWTELQELGIGDCMLGAKGNVMLVEALAKGKNQKLEVLQLQYNQLNSIVFEKLVNMARDSLPNLRKVGIEGNRFNGNNKNVEVLQQLLLDRKEKLGGTSASEDDWGLDSLGSDDSDESDESESDESDPDDDQIKERLSKMAKEAFGAPTVQLKASDNIDEMKIKLAAVEI